MGTMVGWLLQWVSRHRPGRRKCTGSQKMVRSYPPTLKNTTNKSDLQRQSFYISSSTCIAHCTHHSSPWIAASKRRLPVDSYHIQHCRTQVRMRKMQVPSSHRSCPGRRGKDWQSQTRRRCCKICRRRHTDCRLMLENCWLCKVSILAYFFQLETFHDPLTRWRCTKDRSHHRLQSRYT